MRRYRVQGLVENTERVHAFAGAERAPVGLQRRTLKTPVHGHRNLHKDLSRPYRLPNQGDLS
jgi:hypothetical protein